MSEQEAAGEPSADVFEEEHAASESSAGEAVTGNAAAEPPAEQKPLFRGEELSQFDADDAQAGSMIGKLLAMFFLYTVIATSFVAWWTFHAVS